MTTARLSCLPLAWASWRRRSAWIGLAAHLMVDNLFVLLMLAAYLGGQA